MIFLKIGNIKIEGKIALAPMAGVSNPAYMRICEEMGLLYAVTELISSEAIIRDNKKTFDMLNGIESLTIPVGIQIFGSDPKVMGKAAKILEERYKISFIDINMGCPVPKVAVKNNAGSGLLKDPDRIKDIVFSVVNSVSIPVSVKIRIGWDSEHINAVEFAKIAESSGISEITVHGRTREQQYSGKANWDIIGNVKNSVHIPVIGNGDIFTPSDAMHLARSSGVDGIMVGRGVLGNPWIFSQIRELLSGKPVRTVSLTEKRTMVHRHYLMMLQSKPEKIATREMRKHIGWYLHGLHGSAKIRDEINRCGDPEKVLELVDHFFDETERICSGD